MAKILSATISGSTLTITYDEAMTSVQSSSLYTSIGDTISILGFTGNNTNTWTLTLNTIIAPTDYLVMSMSYNSAKSTGSGTYLQSGTAYIGGSGSTVVDGEDNYGHLFFGNGGSDTFLGAGDSDVINLGGTDGASDTVGFGDQWGNYYSLLDHMPLVKGFDVTGTSNNDRLNLLSGTIAANATNVNGLDVGVIASHSITSGIVTFKDAGGYTVIIDTEAEFEDACDYLDRNIITVGTTAAFRVNNIISALVLFQKESQPDYSDNNYSFFTALDGISGAILGNTAGTNVVQIVDTTAPMIQEGRIISTDLHFDFSETVTAINTTGFKLYKNGTLDMGTLIPTINGNMVSFSSAIATLAPSDFVLLDTVTMTATATDSFGNTGEYLEWQRKRWVEGMEGNNTIDLSVLTDVTEAYGGGGDDTLYGGNGNDDLSGGDGNDFLDGGAGNDEMHGGDGDDTYIVRDAGDECSDWWDGGNDTVLTYLADTYLDNWSGIETLSIMGTSAANAYGNSQDNIIIGNSAENLLEGGQGADTLTGGAGNDQFIYSSGQAYTYGHVDTITDFQTGDRLEFSGIAGVTLATAAYAWTTSVDATISSIKNNYLLTNAAYFFTNGADGWLYIKGAGTGTSYNDTLIKLAGRTTPLSGSDTTLPVVSTEGDDILTGDGNNNTLNGLGGNDTLNGLDGNDILNGGTGNDVLDGGAGIDTMIGGLGNDTYIVNLAADIVTELAGEGIDTIQSSITYSLVDTDGAGGNGGNVENLILTGTAAINGTGNALANTLTGNSAANVLEGGAGADIMNGGDGHDTYIVDLAADIVTELAGEGIDTIQSSITYSLVDTDGAGTYGGNVENLTLTGTTAINGAGNGLANTLTGNSSANILDGGAGSDIMIGGLDNDTYIVDLAADIVTELAGEGIDIIQSSITYSLVDTDGAGGNGGNVENLILTGTAAINGTGNVLANTLTGNSAANVLNGGGGADTMIGGLGNDTYLVNLAADIVTELVDEGIDTIQSSITYSLLDTDGAGGNGGNVENLTLTGTAAINGTGNGLNNILTGNTNTNALNGGGGADTMIGGLGSDTYVVNLAADIVTELAGEGIDTIKSSISYSLVDTDGAGSNGGNVENLTLTGTAAINATGNVLANTLTGNSAANVLNGGGGADTMIGGLGNDTYLVNLAADIVTELSGQGIDTIKSSITYSLVDTDGAGGNGGNVEKLTLTGTAAINGTGNGLANTLTGNTAANILSGGGGIDTLNGGLGNDKLSGGTGNDILTGGAGLDTFAFTTALANNIDTITDFFALDDTIQLKNTIFTKLTTIGTLSSDNFLAGTGMAADGNDYILYNTLSGALYYDSDGSGAGAALQFATLTGNPVVTNADFLVV